MLTRTAGGWGQIPASPGYSQDCLHVKAAPEGLGKSANRGGTNIVGRVGTGRLGLADRKRLTSAAAARGFAAEDMA
jgi:hypothetical protein